MVTHGLLGTYRGNMVQRGGRDCVWRYTRDHGGTYSNTYDHGGQQQKKKQYYKQVQEDNKNNTNSTAKNTN